MNEGKSTTGGAHMPHCHGAPKLQHWVGIYWILCTHTQGGFLKKRWWIHIVWYKYRPLQKLTRKLPFPNTYVRQLRQIELKRFKGKKKNHITSCHIFLSTFVEVLLKYFKYTPTAFDIRGKKSVILFLARHIFMRRKDTVIQCFPKPQVVTRTCTRQVTLFCISGTNVCHTAEGLSHNTASFCKTELY